MKMNINTKMLTYILSASVLIFTLSVGYISMKSRQLALSDAEELATKVAQENALIIAKQLSEGLNSLNSLAQGFTVYQDMEEEEWKPLFIDMYYKVFEKNRDFYKLWDSWELRFFDSTYTKNYGRYSVALYRSQGKILHTTSMRSMDGDNPIYGALKAGNRTAINEPYWDEQVEDGEDEQKFMTSLVSPIQVNGEYAGLVGADITMDKFQELVETIKPYDNTKALISSNLGVIVGHFNSNNIGKNLVDVFPEYEEQFQFSDKVKEGFTGSFYAENAAGDEVLISMAPIIVGESNTPWALALSVPVKVILKEANKTQFISLLVSGLGLVFLTIIIFLIARNISTSLVKTTNILKKVSEGDIAHMEKLEINSGDEIEDMANSVNTLTDGLKETAGFATKIGQGDLDADLKILGENDVLGKALLEMKDSLHHAEEEEKKRKIEDDKQNWATEGLAKFGEILRTNSSNIKELSFNIMSNLINYLEVNQGALFVLAESNDDEVTEFEMQTAIAYGRDKFMSKKVRMGEELIGRCAFEKKTIYMTDIPQNYISITSGMGTANPSALLLVPLVLNDEIFGVIELASFHNIEDHQIEFVERLGESIASTISTVKVNETTSKLLDQSKIQSEELAAQEEEMRQNLEELQATQEEAGRREFEMVGVISALGQTAFTAEYDLDGTLTSINEKYTQLLGIPAEEIIGTKHVDGYEFTKEKQADYNLFWGDLKRGISKKETNKLIANGKEVWIEETYTPITAQNDDKPYKILKIGFDITDTKNKEHLMQAQEIKIKKEAMLIGEYRDRIKELEAELKQKKEALKKAKEQKPEPVATSTSIEIKATGNNLLDYTDEFILGIEEMDAQHKQVIDLCNGMYAALKLDKPKKEIKESIKSFIDFASYHFGNEENYFEQFDYADAKEHAKEHSNFIKELSDFQTAYNSNKVKFLDDVINSIKKGLHHHFTQSDKKYVALFKEQGL